MKIGHVGSFAFFLLLFACASVCAVVCGCDDSSAGAVNVPVVSDEEILEPADDYELDLAKISVSTEKGDSYDKENHILHLVTQWVCAQIWLGDFDASQYRYVRIDYEPVDPKENWPFRLHGRYSDNTSSYQLCERKRLTQYCALDRTKKKSLKSVFVQSIVAVPVSFKIKRICFTQNKVLSPAVVDSGGGKTIGVVSAVELVDRMGIGWNLGNTLEAHSFNWQEDPLLQGMEAEFHWETTETTPELLQFAFDKGFRSLRIPVTWYCHIVDGNYTIDPDWMARVKTIVDEAIKIGYYVILNEHHSVHGDHTTEFTVQSDGSKKYASRAMNRPLKRGDGYLVCCDAADIAESKRFLHAIWTQIATAFNSSYDEHLIFETMNEPRNARDDHQPDPKGRTDHEWEPGLKMPWYREDGSVGGYWCDATNCAECLREYEVLNEYNQVCLDAIRATGGANASRFVIVPSLCTGQKTIVHEKFRLPYDTATDKLILSVHSYPFGSSLEGTDKTEYTEAMKEATRTTIETLAEKFVSRGLPIVYGEVGVVRKKVPLSERMKWIAFFTGEARKHKMSLLWWECGGDSAGTMAEINRSDCSLYEPEFVSAMMNAAR